MVTISHITQKLIDGNIIYQEALLMGIVNYNNLARKLKPDVEKIYGEEAKLSSIRAAVERHTKNIQEKQNKFEFNFFKSINLNNDVSYIVVHESPDTLKKIQNIYYDLDLCDGGVFNILQGNHEIAIITKKECEKHVLDALTDDTVTHIENNHDSISLTYSRDYSHIPGLFYNISKNIAWENINVLTWLHTPTELTLIVHEDNSTKCFNILRKMMKEHKKENEKIKPLKKQII